MNRRHTVIVFVITCSLQANAHGPGIDTGGNVYVVQWNANGAYPMKLELLGE